MRYFDHDTTASKDDGIMALRCDHGSAAVDAYWAIIEKMYADEAPVNRLGTKPLTVWLAVGFDQLQKYIDGMIEHGLLECVDDDPDMVYSTRVMNNIASYQAKCETARRNGKMGGRKPTRKPTGNQVGFCSEPKGLAGAKLRKEKKGIGSDKQNLIPGGAGAGGENPAPRPADKAARDMAEQRAIVAEMEANAVPMPEGVRHAVEALARGAR